MPRARCHWALLIQTRDALRDAVPEAHRLVTDHRGEFFAGGIAPDAIRLFAGRDKPSSHFYDDQRQETWESVAVAAAMCAAQPAVADPRRLSPEGRAWLLGYLTHVLTDVAYWRHVLSRLPRLPGPGGGPPRGLGAGRPAGDPGRGAPPGRGGVALRARPALGGRARRAPDAGARHRARPAPGRDVAGGAGLRPEPSRPGGGDRRGGAAAGPAGVGGQRRGGAGRGAPRLSGKRSGGTPCGGRSPPSPRIWRWGTGAGRWGFPAGRSCWGTRNGR